MFDTIVLYLSVILFVVWLATPNAGWRIFAWIVSRRPICHYIIRRAMRTPYSHLPGYMNRYWLFNNYEAPRYIRWLPSARVHQILRADRDRHKHDHPWDARTIILNGWYDEERVVNVSEHFGDSDGQGGFEVVHEVECEHNRREPGDTVAINFGQYHSISAVSEGGVWTLFITFGYRGTWGFLVDGVKVPWREYKAVHPEKPWANEEVSS